MPVSSGPRTASSRLASTTSLDLRTPHALRVLLTVRSRPRSQVPDVHNELVVEDGDQALPPRPRRTPRGGVGGGRQRPVLDAPRLVSCPRRRLLGGQANGG